MVGPVGQAGPWGPNGFFTRVKRGTNFALVGVGVAAIASFFIPIVPLVAVLSAGGVGGAAIAKATGKKK